MQTTTRALFRRPSSYEAVSHSPIHLQGLRINFKATPGALVPSRRLQKNYGTQHGSVSTKFLGKNIRVGAASSNIDGTEETASEVDAE